MSDQAGIAFLHKCMVIKAINCQFSEESFWSHASPPYNQATFSWAPAGDAKLLYGYTVGIIQIADMKFDAKFNSVGMINTITFPHAVNS